LRRQTMGPHLAASGVASSDARHMDRIHAAFQCAAIILRAGEPVGLLKVVREGSQWDLVQIQLVPSLHGKGIGTKILESLIEEARANRASLKLSVLKANPARHLYERLGFAVVADTADSYQMLLRFHE